MSYNIDFVSKTPTISKTDRFTVMQQNMVSHHIWHIILRNTSLLHISLLPEKIVNPVPQFQGELSILS